MPRLPPVGVARRRVSTTTPLSTVPCNISRLWVPPLPSLPSSSAPPQFSNGVDNKVMQSVDRVDHRLGGRSWGGHITSFYCTVVLHHLSCGTSNTLVSSLLVSVLAPLPSCKYLSDDSIGVNFLILAKSRYSYLAINN